MKKIVSVLVTVCALAVVGCGSSPDHPGRSEVNDAGSVQQVVNEQCGTQGIQALTALNHGGSGHGVTSGFLLVCKNHPDIVIAVGR